MPLDVQNSETQGQILRRQMPQFVSLGDLVLFHPEGSVDTSYVSRQAACTDGWEVWTIWAHTRSGQVLSRLSEVPTKVKELSLPVKQVHRQIFLAARPVLGRDRTFSLDNYRVTGSL